MTVVTNFLNLPLEDRFRAAVQFEPDGLEFRRAAQLTLRFPEPIPRDEMIGFAYQSEGTRAHLSPWESESDTVRLEVSHFSGAGTTAQSLASPPRLAPLSPHLTYFDVSISANAALATRLREIAVQQARGELSTALAAQQRLDARAARIHDVLERGIRPFLAEQTSRCNSGRTLLTRLDLLESQTGRTYTTGEPHQIMRQIAPAVRCQCAHEMLEQCEQGNPAGSRAPKGLESVLESLVLNAASDGTAQGCDLGNDAAIRSRLAQATCQRGWTGSIRYSVSEVERAFTRVGNISQSHFRSFHYVYHGSIASLKSEEFIDWEEEDQRPDEWIWVFNTEGGVAGTYASVDVVTNRLDDYLSITTTRVDGSNSYTASSDPLRLRFLGNEFEFLQFALGLGGQEYPILRQESMTHRIQCLLPQSQACSKPRPTTRQRIFSETMHGVMDNQLRGTVVKSSYVGGRLTVDMARTLETPIMANAGTRTSTYLLHVELRRGNAD